MPVQFHRFDKYHINYLTPDYEGRKDQVVIYCSRSINGNGLTEPVGSIRFWKGIVPGNKWFGKNNLNLNYNIDDFSRILDILRSEESFYICMDPETKFGYIATSYKDPG